MSATIEKIHEDIISIKKDLKRIIEYFEEDELKLSDDIKHQIEESRKRRESEMATQEEVEKEFL